MKKTQLSKLKKALALMKQAQALVNDVAAKDEAFRYSSNANFRDNRIEAAVSVLRTEIAQADPDPDGMNEFLNGATSGYSAALIF